jgi:hypothetical protein
MAADLKHRDWLLFSIQTRLLQVNENICVKIIDTHDGGKRLIADGILPQTIELLDFMANTDQNNNYLYLEDFKVYNIASFSPLNIPGLKEVVQHVFRTSDVNAFLKGDKIHKPFDISNYNKNTSFKGTTFNDFVMAFTNLMPYTPNVEHVTYSIVLNPDERSAPPPNTSVEQITNVVPTLEVHG